MSGRFTGAEGEAPVTLYHGTTKLFERFTSRQAMTFGRQPRVADVPIFLSPLRSFAALHAKCRGGRILVVSARLGRTFEGRMLVREDSTFWPPERSDLTSLGQRFHDDLVAGRAGPAIYEDEVRHFIASVALERYDAVEDVDVLDWLQGQGFDSFRVTGDGERNVGVFDPGRLEIVREEVP